MAFDLRLSIMMRDELVEDCEAAFRAVIAAIDEYVPRGTQVFSYAVSSKRGARYAYWVSAEGALYQDVVSEVEHGEPSAAGERARALYEEWENKAYAVTRANREMAAELAELTGLKCEAR